MSGPETLLIPALLGTIGFCVFFSLLWCGVSWLLSRLGGWAHCAEIFGTDEPMPDSARGFESCRFGIVNYSSVVTIAIDREYLWMDVLKPFALGHRRLRIPLEAVREDGRTNMIFLKNVNLLLTTGHRIAIRDRLWDSRPGASPQTQHA